MTDASRPKCQARTNNQRILVVSHWLGEDGVPWELGPMSDSAKDTLKEGD